MGRETVLTDSSLAGSEQPRPRRELVNYAALRPRFAMPAEVRNAALALLPLMMVVFYWTIQQMWGRWNVATGYYNHGPLVAPIALVSAWLIIRRRGLPMCSTWQSRGAGMGLVLGSLLVHLACMFGGITFISGFAMLPLLAGMCLYLGGWPMLRRLWFPIAFLGFMVPLPDMFIFNINFVLKMYASELSTALVNLLGVPVFRRGSDVFLQGGKQMTIDDVCSGLRSLISLLAFSMLFTYACRLRGYKRGLLFLSAVPIAILANVVRITVLIAVAHFWRVELSVPGGWVHDSMGFLVFVFAFCFMFIEEELLDLLPGGRGSAGRSSDKSGPAVKAEAT